MYKEKRHYFCSICGQEDVATVDEIYRHMLYGVSDRILYSNLPKGWKGSHRRNGDCICDKCYRAMQRLKKEK